MNEKVQMPDILVTFVKQLNSFAYENEQKLQIEESGNNIAWSQGFIVGTQEYKNIFKEAGFSVDTKLYDTRENATPFFEFGKCQLELEDLRDIVSETEELADNKTYISFKEIWDKTVEKKKDFLFYKSNKGRDLYFCKGWYTAMDYVKKTISNLEKSLAEAEKEKKEMLF